MLIREILAGFVKVEFVDFWLADQFNSLVGIFMDTEFFLCFLSSHPELSLLPKSNETSPAVIELSSSLGSFRSLTWNLYSSIDKSVSLWELLC